MGNPKRPSGGREDADDDGPYLEDAARVSPFGRWQKACMEEDFMTMEQVAMQALREAMELARKSRSEELNQWIETAAGIYQWIQQYQAHLFESAPMVELQFLKFLSEVSGNSEETIRRGEELFKRRLARIPNLKIYLAGQERTRREQMKDFFDSQPEATAEDFLEALEHIGLREGREFSDIPESFGEKEKQELSDLAIRSFLLRHWILFFQQLHEILEIILGACYALQGKDALPKLKRWAKQATEILNWFTVTTNPFKQGQEIGRRLELQVLDIDFHMWQIRVLSRAWFFEEDVAERRLTASNLDMQCDMFRRHLDKITDPKWHSHDEMEKQLAPKLRNDPRVLYAKTEMDSQLASVKSRWYEYAEGFEMLDESLALVSLHEHPDIQKNVREAVEIWKTSYYEIDQYLKTHPKLDEDMKKKLERRRMLFALRMVENLPKLGRYHEGQAWFGKSIVHASALQDKRYEGIIINTQVFENMLSIAKRLQNSEDSERDNLLKEMQSMGFTSVETLLDAASKLIEQAKTLATETKDKGQLEHVGETAAEVALTMNDPYRAWENIYPLITKSSRPDREEQKTWAYLFLDMIAQCVLSTADLTVPLEIAAESFEEGLNVLRHDLAKQDRAEDFPPTYLRYMEEKIKRIERLVARMSERKKGPPPQDDGDGLPRLIEEE